ncbi:MAG: hypothetical protein SGPRY_011635, partial [Prymnesium sp.]
VELWKVSVFRRAPHADEGHPPPLPTLRSHDTRWWHRLPSKLRKLLALTSELLQAPEERVLIFTQWLSHVRLILSCLQRAHIPALSMSSELAHSMTSLSRFGTEGQPRVLLLSSQYHASGVNLQMARNLIIVHPCEARARHTYHPAAPLTTTSLADCTPSASCPEAVSYAALRAYELQAVGRIRRYPQLKPCRVFRLYSEGSVEESLYSGLYSGRNSLDTRAQELWESLCTGMVRLAEVTDDRGSMSLTISPLAIKTRDNLKHAPYEHIGVARSKWTSQSWSF